MPIHGCQYKERHMRNFARRSAGIYKARDAHLVPWNWRPPMVSIRAEGEEWETIYLTKDARRSPQRSTSSST